MKTLIFTILVLVNSYFVFGQNGYIAFLNRNLKRDSISTDSSAKLQALHMKNIGRLYEAGVLPVAGPFEGGGGLFFFNTKSLKETQDSLQTDAAVRANRWNIEVYKMKFLYGKLCKADKEMKMQLYPFFRFSTKNLKANDLMKNYIKFNPKLVLFVAVFPDKKEGIMVLRSEANEEATLLAAKFINSRNALIFQKKWFTAKGNLCD